MPGRGRGKKRVEHHNKRRVSVVGSERNTGASAVWMSSNSGNNAAAATVTDPPTFGEEHTFPSSSIGLLLCHLNDPSQSSSFLNTTQNLPINVRETINEEKLLAHDTEEQREVNIFWKLVNASFNGDNPLGGKAKFVLAIIGPVASDNGESDNGETDRQFFVHSKKDDLKCPVVPATAAGIAEAMSWVNRKEIAPEASVHQGFAKFLKTIMPILNKPASDLIKFVKGHEWVGPFWNSQDVEDLMADVENANTEGKQWRILRRFITFNFAWQTRLVLCPIDGLHRATLASNILNGISVKGASMELNRMVETLWKRLHPGENGKLMIDNITGGTSRIMDTFMIIDYIAPDVINPEFCFSMLEHSAQTQHDESQHLDHTILNVLAVLQKRIKTHCLVDPAGTRGLTKILNGFGGNLEAFQRLLVSDELCSEEESKFIVSQIKSPNKAKLLDDSTLAGHYIDLWMHYAIKKLYEALVSFATELPITSNIEPAVHLSLFRTVGDKVGMSLEEFRQMFKTHYSDPKERYKSEVFGGNYRWSFDQLSDEQRLVRLLEKDDPYLKPWREVSTRVSTRTRGLVKFPAELLELVWLLHLGTLSPETNEAVGTFLTESAWKLKRQALSCCRCLILCIFSSSNLSYYYWHNGYFDRKVKQTTKIHMKANKMGPRCQAFFVLISATRQWCGDYAKSMHCPAIFTSGISKLEGDNTGKYAKLTDPLFTYTVLFLWQNLADTTRLKEENKGRNPDCSEMKIKLASTLDIGVRLDTTNASVSVRNNHGKGVRNNHGKGVAPISTWLPELSKGGKETLSMAPKEALSPFVSLVQAISRGTDSTRITCRPLEFVMYEATLEVLLKEVIEYFKSGCKTIKSSILGNEGKKEEDEDEMGKRKRSTRKGKDKEEEKEGKTDDPQKNKKRAKKRKISVPKMKGFRCETDPVKLAADQFLKPGGVTCMLQLIKESKTDARLDQYDVPKICSCLAKKLQLEVNLPYLEEILGRIIESPSGLETSPRVIMRAPQGGKQVVTGSVGMVNDNKKQGNEDESSSSEEDGAGFEYSTEEEEKEVDEVEEEEKEKKEFEVPEVEESARAQASRVVTALHARQGEEDDVSGGEEHLSEYFLAI